MCNWNQLGIWACLVVGIFISFVIPVIRKTYGITLQTRTDNVDKYDWRKAKSDLWKEANIYVVILVLSILTSMILYAYLLDTLVDWRAALIAGYVWDSSLQKVGTV